MLWTATCLLVCINSTSAPAQTPTPIPTGIWLGTLTAGPQTLRLQLRLERAPSGEIRCLLDSIDQNAFAIPCTTTPKPDATIEIEAPAVSGHWSGRWSGRWSGGGSGTRSADTANLSGTWTQGPGCLPLSFARQTSAIQTSAIPAPKSTMPATDPALPPATIANIKEILDRDLASSLAPGGALAPETHAGVAIGIVEHGHRQTFSYGPVQTDSVFEIGSISKTFTGLLLAQLTEQGKVRLDEPVRDLLPPGTVAKPAAGPEITLLDLSDQHSGLPHMPDNFHPANPSNPYADYSAALLYAFVAKHGIALPEHATFGYSNLGVGLLGQALSDRAGVPYPKLLAGQITGPLAMRDTAVSLSPDMRARFTQGHSGDHQPAPAWDLDALAGAGGIRSTAPDMLTYLEAQLHPDHLSATALHTPDGKTLPAAIQKSHILHAEAGPGMHIALNWFRVDSTGSFWHNGATGGYSAYALFNPEKDFALVVLSNTTVTADNFTDKLGEHVAQRLAGIAPVSLTTAQHREVAVSPKVLETYVGAYQLAPDFILTVTREGNRLFTQATGQEKIEVYPETEKQFFLKVVDAKVVDAQITFEVDPTGRATGLILHQGGRDLPAERLP